MENPSDDARFVFFWRTAHPFSQWHPCEFSAGGQTFNCTEQFMMYQKALLFGDTQTAALILKSQKPAEQKALGRKVKNFDDARWKSKREQIVYEGNLAKFSQNPPLRSFLLGTGDKILVEASPVDTIWGIGLDKDDPRAQYPEQWRGLNLLGKALMRVRETLQQQQNN